MSKDVKRSQSLERLTAAVGDLKQAYRAKPGASSVANLTDTKRPEGEEKS
jgi:hypothetical protein